MRVAVVTGASSGIGREVARLLLARNYRLVMVSRNVDAMKELLRETGGEGVAMGADLSETDGLGRIIDSALNRFGRIDVLVNNAGVGLYGPIQHLSPSHIDYVIRVNFTAPAILSHMAAKHMVKRREGCIVNVSSLAAYTPLPWFSVYAATKAALKNFTDSLRMELRPYGVRVIGVYPGYVKTGFFRNLLTPSDMYREINVLPPALGSTPLKVAKSIVNAITKGKNGDVYVGLVNRAMREAALHMPRISSIYIALSYRRALRKLMNSQKAYNENQQ